MSDSESQKNGIFKNNLKSEQNKKYIPQLMIGWIIF